MEIKTGKEIVNDVGSFEVLIWDEKEAKRKWVDIDNILERLNKMVTFTMKEELIKELKEKKSRVIKLERRDK